MRLSRLLVLLLLAIIVVVGGWAMYRELFSRRTFSLNQKALEEVVDFDRQNRPTFPEPIALEIDTLEDPFFTTPCYFRTAGACLLSLIEPQQDVFVLLHEKASGSPPSADQVALAVGQMLGTPDHVRRYFAHQSDDQWYFKFVKDLRDRSLENQVSPTLVYGYYDFLLSREEFSSMTDLPDPSLVANLIATGFIMFESDTHSPAASPSSEPVGWPPYGRALLYAARWAFPDKDLIQAAFSQQGEFEGYYLQRFSGDWAQKPFNVRLDQPVVSLDKYRQDAGNTDGLALCYQGNGMICQLVPEAGAVTWHMRCRSAEFLSPLCNDLLINL